MTLLREIQTLLERTYAPVSINLEACLIGEGRCAVLIRLAGESAARLAPGGRTFLRQAGDSLYVAIFYSRPVIAELEGANRGIGYYITKSGNSLDTTGIFAGLFIIMLVALALEAIVGATERRVLRYR